jgi:uncharacterized membrane protein YhdT
MLKRRSPVMMIVFVVGTLGVYFPIWFLRRRAALNRLDSPRKLQRWPFLLALAFFVFQIILAIASDPEKPIGNGSLLFSFVRLVVALLIVVQCFIIKDILEDHLAGPGDTTSSSVLSDGATLSGLMTFFFQIFYLQHVINRHIVGSHLQADVS